MRTAIYATLFSVFLFSLIRCGSGDDDENSGNHALKLELQNYDPHVGQMVRARVLNRTLKTVVKDDEMLLTTANQSFSWPQLLQNGHDYYLDFYADLNGNGACDSPDTDHTWRLKINQASADIAIDDKHNMNFSDICKSFTDNAFPQATGTSVTLRGNLALSNDVTDVDGLTAGQKLQGATVFVEGFPEQEARSNEQGQFELVFNVNAVALAEGSYQLVMWYTQKSTDASSSWGDIEARVGARKEITLPGGGGGQLDVETVELTYTKLATLKLQDKDSGAALSVCRISVPAYDFQLFVDEFEAGSYRIDYLPKGDYTAVTHCAGYADKSVSLSIEGATKKGDTQDLGVIEMEKSS